MKPALRSIAVIVSLTGLPAWAAGDEGPATHADPAITRFEVAAKAGDWPAAARAIEPALRADPARAEYHNRYAFALRKGPAPDMTRVMHHYREALRIDPEHRGAHEYIGEAYLMLGDPAKAREHLAALDRLCTFGCKEYDDLKHAIAAAEAKR